VFSSACEASDIFVRFEQKLKLLDRFS